MKLIDLFPDPEVLCALQPDELGLRMLPVFANWHTTYMSQPSLRVALEAWIRGRYPGEFAGRHQAQVEVAIREAWAWLEGSGLLLATNEYQQDNKICGLSRRAQQLAKESDPRRVFAARHIPKASLHPSIQEDVWALYHRGKYDTAVFEAMKAVEVAVRDAAKLTSADIGTKLMRRAFEVDNGPLTDKAAEQGERQARSDLFAGAIGSYKNPHSHRNVALDAPDEAAEIIMLANHLLRIVDGRRAGGGL